MIFVSRVATIPARNLWSFETLILAHTSAVMSSRPSIGLCNPILLAQAIGFSPIVAWIALQVLRDVSIWDSLDRSPTESRLIFKLEVFMCKKIYASLSEHNWQTNGTWVGFRYFSKNLNSNNLSNAYVSGMKEYLNVVGNASQTFTTM